MIDANTIVSAALNPDGAPRAAIAAARTTYGEIAEVLKRRKFARVLTEDRRPRNPGAALCGGDLGGAA